MVAVKKQKINILPQNFRNLDLYNINTNPLANAFVPWKNFYLFPQKTF